MSFLIIVLVGLVLSEGYIIRKYCSANKELKEDIQSLREDRLTAVNNIRNLELSRNELSSEVSRLRAVKSTCTIGGGSKRKKKPKTPPPPYDHLILDM